MVSVAQPGPGPTILTEPNGEFISADVSTVRLYLSEPVVGSDARDAATYELWDVGGETSLAVTPSYVDGELLIELTLSGVLADGLYRLTVASGDPGIRDLEGYALDGNSNGVVGDDLVYAFRIDRVWPALDSAAIHADRVEVTFLDVGGIDPADATDAANYGLVRSGGDGTFADGNEIDVTALIDSITFDEVTQTATIGFAETLPDDIYRLTIAGTVADLAGNALAGGAGAEADLALSTAPASVTIDLIAEDDSGASALDDITSVTTPTFDVIVSKAGLVEIDFDGDGSADESFLAATAGTHQRSFSFAEGVHTISATLTPAAEPAVTDDLTITVDTTAPTLADDGSGGVDVTISPTTIEVVFADAGGMSNSVRVAGSYRLVASGGDGTFGDGNEIDRSGRITLVNFNATASTAVLNLSGTLDDEVYQLTINVDGGIADLAGNALAAGEALIVERTLDAAPTQVSVDLAPASDTGASSSDDLTTDNEPAVLVTVNGPGVIGVDFDGDDVVDVLRDVSESGVYAIDSPVVLPAGEATVSATFTPMLGAEAGDDVTFTIDRTAPTVTGIEPSGVVNAATGEVVVGFDEPIDQATAWAIQITNPAGGPVTITSVQYLGGSAYRLRFATQTAQGVYTVSVGAGVRDVAGNEAVPFVETFTQALADLAATNASTTPSANFGETIHVQWTVDNMGDGPTTASWLDRIYLVAPGGRSCWRQSRPIRMHRWLLTPGMSATRTWSCRSTRRSPTGRTRFAS